jgi:hypothetical protein
MIDITANLSSAEIKGAITDADSRVREAIEAIAAAYDASIHAAILCGITYYQAPVGKGGRRASGTLEEVSALLKGHRWAGKNTNLGLPNLQTKEQMTRFAMAGVVFQQGGTILTSKNDIVGLTGDDKTPGVLTLINNAKRANMSNETIMDYIVGQGDAQAAYDALRRGVSEYAKAKKAKDTEATTEETTEETTTTTTTTDADLVQSVLSILSGWHNDGTANIDAIFDKVAEIAGASIPATVMA